MLNFSISEGLIIFLFCLISAFTGAFVMYLHSRYIFKIIIDETLSYTSLEAKEILTEYKNSTDLIEVSLVETQRKTIKRFELINNEIQSLNNVLIRLKSHLLKVENLENDIVKYKKIIKRLEKKSCLRK